jgi:HlyD family secretion protein
MNIPMRIDLGDHPGHEAANDAPANVVSSARLRRALLYVAGVFLLLFLLAAFVPIGGAVLGTGQVGVESRVKRIAHPTGGVIAQILVANGEQVEAGQLLMRLDDRVTGADALYSNLTVEQLLAQRARLEAERLGTGAIVFPAELTSATTGSARRAIEDERRLFGIRGSEQAQLRAQLASRIIQLNDEIGGYQAQIQALRKQRALVEPERQSVQELWDAQLVTISRVNQLERTAADLEGNIAALQAQIASTRGRITETQEQAIQLREARRAEAGQELAQINTALNQQQLRSVAALDQQDRSEIRAPSSGTVEKIAFAAIGEVVRPAEPIMEIVPTADQMVVEALVAPEDIDRVRAGQPAVVRFTSFNMAATPEIKGQVTYVAADRSENREAQQFFYMARIEVDQQDLAREGLRLRSGMPAEVHIQTGNRSLLSYVFKPFQDQLARAFRYD